MHFENGPTPSIGLLHILEDAAALLRGSALEPTRRGYVLSEVEKLITEAREGSEISKNTDAFVVPGKWRMLQSYTLLSRYLGEDSMQLDANALEQLLGAVMHLSAGEPIPHQQCVAAATTLKALCEQMSQDVTSGITSGDEQLQIAV